MGLEVSMVATALLIYVLRRDNSYTSAVVTLAVVVAPTLFLKWIDSIRGTRNGYWLPRLTFGDNRVLVGREYGLLPRQIKLISIAPDPYEDFAEESIPIKLCELTVRRGPWTMCRVTVSVGDAIRVLEWAKQHGILTTSSFDLVPVPE